MGQTLAKRYIPSTHTQFTTPDPTTSMLEDKLSLFKLDGDSNNRWAIDSYTVYNASCNVGNNVFQCVYPYSFL